MNYIIVTFDENMMTTGPSSVTNPQNWALLENGSQMVGGIQEIYFGLNEAAALSQDSQFANLGLPTAGSNKYEAVLMLNGTGRLIPPRAWRSLVSGRLSDHGLEFAARRRRQSAGTHRLHAPGLRHLPQFRRAGADRRAVAGLRFGGAPRATTILAGAVLTTGVTITVTSAAASPRAACRSTSSLTAKP